MFYSRDSLFSAIATTVTIREYHVAKRGVTSFPLAPARRRSISVLTQNTIDAHAQRHHILHDATPLLIPHIVRHIVQPYGSLPELHPESMRRSHRNPRSQGYLCYHDTLLQAEKHGGVLGQMCLHPFQLCLLILGVMQHHTLPCNTMPTVLSVFLWRGALTVGSGNTSIQPPMNDAVSGLPELTRHDWSRFEDGSSASLRRANPATSFVSAYDADSLPQYRPWDLVCQLYIAVNNRIHHSSSSSSSSSLALSPAARCLSRFSCTLILFFSSNSFNFFATMNEPPVSLPQAAQPRFFSF